MLRFCTWDLKPSCQLFFECCPGNLIQTLFTNRKWYYLERLVAPYYLSYFDLGISIILCWFVDCTFFNIRHRVSVQVPLQKPYHSQKQ